MRFKNLSINKISSALAIIIVLVYVFFWEYRFVVHSWAWLSIAGFFALISVFTSTRINCSRPVILLFVFLAINVLGIVLTPADISSVFKWCLTLFVVLTFAFMLCNTSINCKKILKAIAILSLFFAVGVFVNAIDSEFVCSINRIVLKEESYDSFLLLNSYGYYPGFSGFNSVSGFYCGMASIVFFSLSFFNKGIKRIIPIILSLLAFIAIVLTQKRSIVIAVPASILLILIIRRIYAKSLKSFVFLIIISAALILGVFLVLTKTDSGQLMLKRFSNSDISSGRIDRYTRMLDNWGNYAVFGNGPSSTKATFNADAHNIYLQVFYENGFIGSLVFVLFIVCNMLPVLQAWKKNSREKNESFVNCIASFGIQSLFIIYGFSGNCLTDSYFLLLYVLFSSMPFLEKQFAKDKKQVCVKRDRNIMICHI